MQAVTLLMGLVAPLLEFARGRHGTSASRAVGVCVGKPSVRVLLRARLQPVAPQPMKLCDPWCPGGSA
jgi:hypothetical protein